MTEKLPRSVVEPKNPRLNVSRGANLPHVPGIRVGDYIFLSGMGPIDPQTGERNHGPIAEQIRTTLSNMQHMLESAGSSLERVVRVHVVLADISHMAEMDRVYREFFPVDPPARTAWSMQLRFGNGCEIECVALANCHTRRISIAISPRSCSGLPLTATRWSEIVAKSCRC
jgi:2-iminobutanoate/2-iminopropanoate deaminase